jgi:pyruvate formate lyase activating enzyme
VLTNLRFIAAHNPEKVIIRVPVIPGFNNDPKEISTISHLAEQLKVKGIDFLPYHKLGIIKYEQLGRTYSFGNTTPV